MRIAISNRRSIASLIAPLSIALLAGCEGSTEPTPVEDLTTSLGPLELKELVLYTPHLSRGRIVRVRATPADPTLKLEPHHRLEVQLRVDRDDGDVETLALRPSTCSRNYDADRVVHYVCDEFVIALAEGADIDDLRDRVASDGSSSTNYFSLPLLAVQADATPGDGVLQYRPGDRVEIRYEPPGRTRSWYRGRSTSDRSVTGGAPFRGCPCLSHPNRRPDTETLDRRASGSRATSAAARSGRAPSCSWRDRRSRRTSIRSGWCSDRCSARRTTGPRSDWQVRARPTHRCGRS